MSDADPSSPEGYFLPFVSVQWIARPEHNVGPEHSEDHEPVYRDGNATAGGRRGKVFAKSTFEDPGLGIGQFTENGSCSCIDLRQNIFRSRRRCFWVQLDRSNAALISRVQKKEQKRKSLSLPPSSDDGLRYPEEQKKSDNCSNDIPECLSDAHVLRSEKASAIAIHAAHSHPTHIHAAHVHSESVVKVLPLQIEKGSTVGEQDEKDGITWKRERETGESSIGG